MRQFMMPCITSSRYATLRGNSISEIYHSLKHNARFDASLYIFHSNSIKIECRVHHHHLYYYLFYSNTIIYKIIDAIYTNVANNLLLITKINVET